MEKKSKRSSAEKAVGSFQPDFGLSIPQGEHFWILYSPGEKEILIEKGSESPFHTGGIAGIELTRSFVIGTQDGRRVCCGEIDEGVIPSDGYEWTLFRDFYRMLDRSSQFPVSRGKALLGWDRTHIFCGICGAKTEPREEEPSRVCPACGEVFYPRLSPAVIVRITRDDQIMLAHNRNFPDGLFSHIAGFVEAGESLEQAVRREIREEVGLEVENIRLFGSQPWPMPYSLMIAFTAECPEGEPVPDGLEISDARWFNKEDMPVPPSNGSIAMAMIEDFLEKG